MENIEKDRLFFSGLILIGGGISAYGDNCAIRYCDGVMRYRCLNARVKFSGFS